MTTLGSSQIIQNAYWDSLEKMSLDVADRERAQNNIAFIARQLDQYDAAVSEINQNGDLSAKGRAAAILAKSDFYLKAMEAQTSTVLAALTAQIGSSNAKLNQAASGPDASVISEMRAQEVRAWFVQIEPILRPQEYQKLIRAGNIAAAIAIENAPAEPLLDMETIAEGRAARAARLMPNEAFSHQSATDVKDLLSSSLRFARKHFSLGVTADPLQVAAAGGYPIDCTA